MHLGYKKLDQKKTPLIGKTISFPRTWLGDKFLLATPVVRRRIYITSHTTEKAAVLKSLRVKQEQKQQKSQTFSLKRRYIKSKG